MRKKTWNYWTEREVEGEQYTNIYIVNLFIPSCIRIDVNVVLKNVNNYRQSVVNKEATVDFESWTLNDAAASLKAFEMLYYRRIFHIFWAHHITNESFLQHMTIGREVMKTVKERKGFSFRLITRNNIYSILHII